MGRFLLKFLIQEGGAALQTLVACCLVRMFSASSSSVGDFGSSFAPFVVASFVLVLGPSSGQPVVASFAFAPGPSSGLLVGASFVLVLGPFVLVALASFALAFDQPVLGEFAVVSEVSLDSQTRVLQVS